MLAAARPLAYLDLRETLQRQIENGALPPGRPLPGERELAERHGVSRVTVRKAIAGLVADGLLVQRRGSGTFVGARIERAFSHLTSFSDELRARGIEPGSRTLSGESGAATPDEAMALGLAPGARVIRLRRLRLGGEQPLALERSTLPAFALASAAGVRDSLYAALDRRGLRPCRALQRLRAVAFDAEAARLLGVKTGSPGLLIERRGFLADGRVVEFTRSHYRGDAYDFVAELRSD
ncbi:GntR family transcriptional regulator [Dokdonella ginsengisoli]|uniref:GntR family transcriptional regulator n=1 Tax=Dokdonella ginsengisoli TaxID=363846 RepID=A0ABV9QSL8_9GAMM